MKHNIKELKDVIKDIESMDDGLSKEEKINRILEMIKKCMPTYPYWVDKPGQDRYYAVPLYLHKSQILLIKEGLEKLLLLQWDRGLINDIFYIRHTFWPC